MSHIRESLGPSGDKINRVIFQSRIKNVAKQVNLINYTV